MFYRLLLFIILMVVASTVLSVQHANVVPAKYMNARTDPNTNYWISYNKNLFNRYHNFRPYKLFSNILLVSINRSCKNIKNIICVTCQEFNNFKDQCPDVSMDKKINLYILGTDSCSLKTKIISSKLPNFNCTIFGDSGFTYTFN